MLVAEPRLLLMAKLAIGGLVLSINQCPKVLRLSELDAQAHVGRDTLAMANRPLLTLRKKGRERTQGGRKRWE